MCAAIGVSGPSDRFKPRNLKLLAPTVVSVAQQISARLGYRPQRDVAAFNVPSELVASTV